MNLHSIEFTQTDIKLSPFVFQEKKESHTGLEHEDEKMPNTNLLSKFKSVIRFFSFSCSA